MLVVLQTKTKLKRKKKLSWATWRSSVKSWLPFFVASPLSSVPYLSLSVCLSGRWMPCRQHTNSLTWFSEGVFGLVVASQVSQLKWEKQKTIWGKWWSFDKLQIRFFFLVYLLKNKIRTGSFSPLSFSTRVGEPQLSYKLQDDTFYFS